ncbi:MAG TPA: SLC13 family permease [Vitreimonas sp.]|nr:SLC13 family permease [Vitreimonas sp.]
MFLAGLTTYAVISIFVLVIVYFFLITEKLPKALVAVLGGVTLIMMQVFKSAEGSSQDNAFEFISHNLDILGFVIGMMVLVGIVRESGVFEAAAIGLVKVVKGKPTHLVVALGYLTLFMTAFFSNIPTVLILAPVVLVLIKELKLPALPFLFTIVTMANLGGAMTPISDPTTYYQAKTVGLTFMEVLQNSGLIVMILSVVSLIYILFVFRNDLNKAHVKASDVALFKPLKAIQNRYIMKVGVPLVVISILLMVLKERIAALTGITLDNATITIGASFLSILIFHKEPREVFRNLIDWEIIFFFMGLFVVVGALEFTHVITLLAEGLIEATGGNLTALLFLISLGSGFLSTFIDNVPYNITMVGAIQAMEASGIWVYPLWWALNLGTSIGGFGSPIAAACNVIAFGQAEKEKIHINFMKYLLLAMPLVVINSLITFGILWLKYLA